MPKGKITVFYCQECGNETSKWSGQCPACRKWNTLVEETVDRNIQKTSKDYRDIKPSSINDIVTLKDQRVSTSFEELDRVLGGGIVQGSLTLIGGDPGIGKSTLLLQVCRNLCAQNIDVLYISGEESLQQIKIRADRIGTFNDSMQLLCETDLDAIKSIIEKNRPKVVVIDSIQTMLDSEISSAPGSVSQIRESTNVFMKIAKTDNISIFIVGHVSKDGAIAGPRVLEHMVDTVLYFEGDRHASYRILRGVKNRFGSTNEIGVFEMRDTGLQEVANPSEYMLDGRPENANGSIVTCSIEGTRPILVEIQALIQNSGFGTPRRTAVGCDYNRVNLLMAVMEQRAGLHLNDYDAYINIAGGIRMNEPAVDLGIVIAIASNYKKRSVPGDVLCFGEVGLSGEVRSVSMASQRVAEAEKLGFKKCILPYANLKNLSMDGSMELIGVKNINEAISCL